MPQLIDDYLGSIDRKLSFDRRLASRAREDIEEYCSDVAAERQVDSGAAERLAIDGFGDADAVARMYAASALGHQVQKTWISLALVVVAAFVAMRLRSLSLGPVAVDGGDMLLLIDRMSLTAALCCGMLGWLAHTRSAFALWPWSPRTAFDLSIFAVATSIGAGTIRAAAALDAGVGAGHVPLVIMTVGAELALLLTVHARVRRLGCYFDRAAV